jgi:hypothetical protein
LFKVAGDVPGPGFYHREGKQREAAAAKPEPKENLGGRAERFLARVEEAPGPGQY